jgi:steroid 5-alpha reductase family enzyme
MALFPAHLTWLDWLGALVFLFGVAFEAIGDMQLAVFKGDPANRGKVMDRGLWRYTRHPNYFGEAVVWWGAWIVTLSTDYWPASLIGPVVITFLLLKVSGVTMLEKDITSRRPGYEEYVRRTSAFVPMPPKDK